MTTEGAKVSQQSKQRISTPVRLEAFLTFDKQESEDCLTFNGDRTPLTKLAI
jgi:hypothetical protein